MNLFGKWGLDRENCGESPGLKSLFPNFPQVIHNPKFVE
jgi:hypothetical protein